MLVMIVQAVIPVREIEDRISGQISQNLTLSSTKDSPTTTTTTPKTWVTFSHYNPIMNTEVHFVVYLYICVLRTCLKRYHRMCMLYAMAFDAETQKETVV